MTGKKHNYGIDWLRAIACIGIVMMHMLSKDNNRYEVSGYFFETIIPSFTDFVFLFMVLSAFGMCAGYYGKVKSGNVNWVDFYKKRYAKILPFFALLVIIDIIMEFSISSLIEGFADITLLFGLFPNGISVIGVGWFLGLVFAFYLIFPFFCVLINNKVAAWISFVVSLMLNHVCGYYFGLERNNIIFSLCFFFAGGLVYLYREQIEKIKWYFYIPFVAASIVCYYVIGGNTYTRLIVSSTLLIMSIALNIRNIKSISFISGLSMEIYLSHMVIFRGIEKIHINTMFGNGWIQYFITVLIVLTGAICFSTIVKRMICIIENKIIKN